MKFDSRSQALQLFLDAVQGHMGDAIAIIRRLQTFSYPDGLISEAAVQQPIEGFLPPSGWWTGCGLTAKYS